MHHLYDSSLDSREFGVNAKEMGELPEPWYRGRWTARKKAAVVDAISDGSMTPETARSWYELSADELAAWMRLYAAHGELALKTTHLRRYRVTSG